MKSGGTLLAIAACAGIVAAALAAVLHLRALALEQAGTNLTNLSRAISAQTAIVLQDTTEVLEELRDWLERHPQATPGEVLSLFRERKPKTPFLRSLVLVGADGTLRLSTHAGRAPPLDFADRPWFQQARDGTAAGALFGAPVVSRFDGAWVIPVSMRLRDGDGRFAGAVSASLDPEFFQRLFQEYDLGAGSAITLQRSDGTVLARQPHGQETLGKTFAGPIYHMLRDRSEGLLRARSAIDGRQRLMTGRMVGTLPVYVAISMTEDAVFAAWRHQAIIIGGIASALFLSVFALGLGQRRLRQQVAARKRIEGELYLKVEELHATSARLDRILQTAGEGIYGIDAHNRVTFVNRAAAEILGWPSPLDLIGMDGNQALHHRTADGQPCTSENCAIRRCLDDGEPRHVDDEYFVDSAGRARPVEFVVSALRAGDRVAGAVVVFRDISARRMAERQIAEAHRELTRSNAELEQFAYFVSHDLREPLRMVTSFLALIERRLDDRLEGETREFIDFAVDGARRMDGLIQDLLQYSRIGRVAAPAEPMDPLKAIGLALTNLHAAIDECQAEIAVPETAPAVIGREDELVRLFQNLVGNALKYRTPGRPAHVAITAERRDGECLFAVADDGIGIAPEHLERIFGIFTRLHSRQEYEGTGIGLAICRKIVEGHGGRIWAESQGPGTGSAFRFTLPIAPA